MSNVLLMFLKALLNVLVAVQASFGGHPYGPTTTGLGISPNTETRS